MSVTAFMQILMAQRKADLGRIVYEEARFLMEKMVKEIRNNTVDYAFYYLEQNRNTGLNYYDYLKEPSFRSNSIVKIVSKQDMLAVVSPDGKIRTMFWRDGNLSTGSNEPADPVSMDKEIYRLVTKKMTYLNANNPLPTPIPTPQPKESFKSIPPEDPFKPGNIDMKWGWYAASPYTDANANNEPERIHKNWSPTSSADVTIDELHFFISPQQDPHQFWDTSTISNPEEQASLLTNQRQPQVTIVMKVSPIGKRMRGIPGNPPTISLQTTISSRFFHPVHYQGWPQEYQ